MTNRPLPSTVMFHHKILSLNRIYVFEKRQHFKNLLWNIFGIVENLYQHIFLHYLENYVIFYKHFAIRDAV